VAQGEQTVLSEIDCAFKLDGVYNFTIEVVPITLSIASVELFQG